jgi:hypothetical protein
VTVVVRAVAVCSGEECMAEYEVVGPFAEVEAVCCDCGLGVHVLGWPESVDFGPYEGDLSAVRLTVLPLGSSPE